MREWIKDADKACPLRVSQAEWDGTILNLRGGSWTLSIWAPWRCVKGNIILFGSDETGIYSEIETLVGMNIEGFSLMNAFDLDISLIFEENLQIHIFCASRLENWVLKLPGTPLMPFVPNI